MGDCPDPRVPGGDEILGVVRQWRCWSRVARGTGQPQPPTWCLLSSEPPVLPWASGFWNLGWKAAVCKPCPLDDELTFHPSELCVAPGTPAVWEISLSPGAVAQREGMGTTPPCGPNAQQVLLATWARSSTLQSGMNSGFQP